MAEKHADTDVRFYDPSGNLIEVRTPWDKFMKGAKYEK